MRHILVMFSVCFLFSAVALSCGDPEISSRVDLRNSGVATTKTVSQSKPVEGSWKQYLGNSRDARSTESGLQTDWQDKTPDIIWRHKLGDGFTSFIIANSKAYTKYAKGSDEYLVCLDASTGETVWKYRTGDNFAGRMGGDGPRSTPTYNDGMIYVYSTFGVLHALNAENGQAMWQKDVAKIASGEMPRWGYCTSPLIEGNSVIVEAGGGNGKSMVAFDRKSGELLWMGGNDVAGYSSPIAVTINDVRQIVCFTGSKLMGLAPDNGKILWETEWKTSYDVNAATPLFIAPNRIFISSEYDVGAGLYAINGDASGMRAEQLWKTRGMKNKMSTSVYHDGSIYGFDGKTLKCIDLATGEDRWRQRGFGEGSLIYADGHIIVLGDKGTLAIAEATSDSYKEVSSAKVMDGKSWTVPALAGGRLYLRNVNEILCINLNS
ncbi:MAG: PQQ-binding-like beta-propeller repeat protein [Calditrichia bacterium]